MPPPRNEGPDGRSPTARVARGRLSIQLGLLGIPTGGLTAVAGLALGLAGLLDRPRRAAIAGVGVSTVVIAAWIGGLAGSLEYMKQRVADVRTNHLYGACSILSRRMVDRLVLESDPADPRTWSATQVAEALAAVPARLREYGDPPTPLSVELLPAPPGTIARWRVGPGVDLEAGSIVGDVQRPRSGLFTFAADGREVWSFKRAFEASQVAWDDETEAILAATEAPARAIVEAARADGGTLPDAVRAARILEEAGFRDPPRYRRRPGGLFDLETPDRRRRATFAAFGGVLVPVLP